MASFEKLGNLSDLLKNPSANGVPLEIELDKIDEDPNQPRKSFDMESLGELAATIIERGVKSPISLRPSTEEGRYIINHGARRYRASKIAGKTTIPAFIDNDFLEADQLIENLQRENLAPMEIATTLDNLKGSGTNFGDIAKKIGKSNAYVTQHLALLKLPSIIAQALESGKTQDVTLLYELGKDYKKYPKDVESFLEEPEISRSAWKDIKNFLADDKDDSKKAKKGKADADEENSNIVGDGHGELGERSDEQDESESRREPEERSYDGGRSESSSYESGDKSSHSVGNKHEIMKKYVWQGVYHDRVVELNFKFRPSSNTTVWCKFPDGTPDAGEEFEAQAEEIVLIGSLEDY
ncbi:MAG: ParB/RepB/Spo0J family partition protein [Deltaproteobacteria bacterium]|jgi:ParB family chromosome partitioning protein|nr:ParB/RepB/Spo0J family partition protein [Deltaproteobacteria bacterium]